MKSGWNESSTDNRALLVGDMWQGQETERLRETEPKAVESLYCGGSCQEIARNDKNLNIKCREEDSSTLRTIRTGSEDGQLGCLVCSTDFGLTPRSGCTVFTHCPPSMCVFFLTLAIPVSYTV